jgi:hypothetical protein
VKQRIAQQAGSAAAMMGAAQLKVGSDKAPEALS